MALHMLADIQGNPIREEEFEKEPRYASFAGSPFRSFSLRLLPLSLIISPSFLTHASVMAPLTLLLVVLFLIIVYVGRKKRRRE